jgi:hypothetical protein
MNYTFDSQEEEYFNEYLIELKENNIIYDYKYHNEKIKICEKVNKEFLTTSGKIKSEHLMHDLEYTYDFKIYWNPEESNGIFYKNMDDDKNVKYSKEKLPFYAKNDISYIDVKGTFIGKYNNSAITFPIIQKVLYVLKGIFVQKIIPIKLFELTFVPKILVYTKKTNKLKKYSFDIKSLEYFLNLQKNKYTHANRGI